MDFDAAYYDRFYLDKQTRASSPAEQRRQARFVASYLRYLDVPVERILDIGCGLGALLIELEKAFPKATAIGVEYSEYLCSTRGWTRGSAVDYTDDPYDLVVCTDVLGYLDDDACAKAIGNLARLTTTALYLSVLTREDLAICDPERTDMRQQARPYAWYRARLDEHFVAVGGGLFLSKPLSVSVWRLERT